MAKDGTTTENVEIAVGNSAAFDELFKKISSQIDSIAGQMLKVKQVANAAGTGFDQQLMNTLKELNRGMSALATFQKLLAQQKNPQGAQSKVIADLDKTETRENRLAEGRRRFAKELETIDQRRERAKQKELDDLDKEENRENRLAGTRRRVAKELETIDQRRERAKQKELDDLDKEENRENRLAEGRRRFGKELVSIDQRRERAKQKVLDDLDKEENRENRLADIRRRTVKQLEAIDAKKAASVAAEERLVRQYDTRLARQNIPNQISSALETRGEDATRLKIENDIAAARERYNLVGAKDKQQAFEILSIEEKRLAELNRQVAAEERQLEARRRLAVSIDKALIPGQVRDAVSATGPYEVRAAAADRVLAAELALQHALKGEEAELRDILNLERQRLSLAEKAVRQFEREQKANAPKPGPSILPSGGIGAVLARTLAYGLAGTAVFAVVGALKDAVTAEIELEDALGKLQAIAGATDGQMTDLTASILKVGESSRFSVSELTEASTTLAQAGFSIKDIQSSLQAVSNLAAASGSTMAQSVDIITSTISSFNLQTSDATRISDSFAAALNRSKLTIADIQQAISTTGSTAAESNLTFQDLAAAIGAMTQAGVRGSRAATGLRQLLIDLKNPNKELSEELRKLGLSFSDIDVSTQGLDNVLANLRSHGFGSAEAFKTLENRSAAAYLTLSRMTGVMQDIAKAETQVGAATDAASKATNTLSAQWQIFKNKLVIDPAILNWLRDYLKVLNEGTDKASFVDGFEKNNAHMANAREVAEQAWEAQHRLNLSQEVWNAKLDEAATKAKNASEKFTNQQQTLSALDEAIKRIVSRQNSLKTGSAALANETLSLSQQFQGLGLYLDSTKSSFDNLFQAAERYRGSQLKIMQAQAGLVAQQYQGLADTSTQNAVVLADQFVSRLKQVPQNRRPNAQTASDLRAVAKGADGSPISPELIAKVQAEVAQIPDAILRQLAGKLITAVQGVQGATTLRKDAQLQGAKYAVLDQPEYRLLQTAADGLTNSDADKPKVTALITKVTGILSKYKNAPPAVLGALQDILENLQGKQGSPGSLTDPAAGLKTYFGMPVNGGRITSNFGEQGHRGTDGRAHTHGGIDIAVPVGTPVRAVADGVVTLAGGRGEYGNVVYIDTGGAETRDAHLSKISVQNGQRVSKGDIIGYSGGAKGAAGSGNSTGAHLHHEVRVNGKPVNPIGDKAIDPSKVEDIAARVAQKQAANQEAIDKMALNNVEGDLKDRLDKLSDATSFITFDTLKNQAEASFNSWAKEYRRIIEDKIAKNKDSLTGGQIDLMRQEMEKTIADKHRELIDKTLDSSIKVVDNAFKAAQTAFDLAIAPSQNLAAQAAARVEGLDILSNTTAVPDYVKTLAQQRANKQNVSAMQAQLPAANDQIASAQKALDDFRLRTDPAKLDSADAEKATQHLAELTKQYTDLVAARDQLQQKIDAQGALPRNFGEGLRMAAEAQRGAADFGLNFSQILTQNVGGALDEVHNSLQGFFTDIFTGSTTALGAFGNMAKGLMRYMEELAAKAIATQIFNLILGLIPGSGGAGADITVTRGGTIPMGKVHGGPVPGFDSGGRVTNGMRGYDSVHAKLAKGEWVVQSSAVDSVGDDFMRDLNKRGAGALKDLKRPMLMQNQKPSMTNVYVVAPEHKQQMGPNDVLAVINDDVLRGGQTKALIKAVAAGA